MKKVHYAVVAGLLGLGVGLSAIFLSSRGNAAQLPEGSELYIDTEIYSGQPNNLNYSSERWVGYFDFKTDEYVVISGYGTPTAGTHRMQLSEFIIKQQEDYAMLKSDKWGKDPYKPVSGPNSNFVLRGVNSYRIILPAAQSTPPQAHPHP
jgi:hypothetical protein